MKKLLSLLLALVLVLGLTACQSAESPAESPVESPAESPVESPADSPAESPADSPAETQAAFQDVTLVVGATPAPHAQILNDVVKPLLAEQGITLEVSEFTDYVLPNTALEEGDLDANYFQHISYLNNFNLEHGTNLVSAVSVHFEPLGIYAGKSSDLSAIPEGAQIAVPNDTTNEARALQLLVALGIIELEEGVGLEATALDITANPYNVEIVEIEAAQVPRTLQDVDFAVCNGNYALDAGITDQLLDSEANDSEGATAYANVLAVRAGDETRPEIQALVAALTSEEVRSYIEETYGANVVPVF